MKKLLLPLLIGITLSSSTYAQKNNVQNQVLSNENTGEDKYFTDRERGWFWYEKLTQEEKEELRKKLESEQPKPSPQAKPPKTKPLSQKWFRENFEKYQDAAMNNPYDKEAMRTYLYLEKFMRDRAMAFGMERQKAVMAEPFLDSTSTRPIANFGMKTMNIQATENKKALLGELGKQSGLYYFYRGDDSFSKQQADLIALLAEQFGFTILPISMDGTPPPEILGSEFEVNKHQAEVLNIQVLPATYLFNPNNGVIELVSQGMHSLTDLQDRILHASLRGGLIDEQQFQLTKPSGLYSSPDGYVSGPLNVPANAPQEFLNLYNQSQQ